MSDGLSEKVVIAFSMGIISFTLYKLFQATTKSRNILANSQSRFGLSHLFDFHHNDTQTPDSKISLPPNLVLVSDLDHTLIGQGPNETQQECEENLKEFNQLWLSKYAPNNGVLVYATGRSFDKFQMATSEWALLKPDVLICQDGVMIYWFNQKLTRLVQLRSTHHLDLSFNDESTSDDFVWKDESWQSKLNESWNQEFAESLHWKYKKLYKNTMVDLPPGSLNIELFRISVLVKTDIDAKFAVKFFEENLNKYNENCIKNNKKIMKIHSFYCIERGTNHWWAAFTPENGGKGCALEWLHNRLHINSNDNKLKNRLIICGDSGNDISMLSDLHYQSVIVGNSSVELKSFYEKHKENKGENMLLTTKHRTLGVIEGLEHFTNKNKLIQG